MPRDSLHWAAYWPSIIFPPRGSIFLTQLETFPRSPRNGEALYGLAKLAADKGDDEQAEKWLRRFEAETPFHAEAPPRCAFCMRGCCLLSGSPGGGQRCIGKPDTPKVPPTDATTPRPCSYWPNSPPPRTTPAAPPLTTSASIRSTALTRTCWPAPTGTARRRFRRSGTNGRLCAPSSK